MAKKKELKKHSSAIHANGKLSLLERKLSNVMLFNAYDELLTERVHSINVYALAEVCGFNSKNVEALKEAIRNLATARIEWDILNEDGSKKWGVSTLLSSVEIEKGTCTYEYSRALAEKFASPELYGVINLEIQKNFNSGHALTIYEICSRFKGILSKRSHCYTHWYTLEQFKKFLGLNDLEYYKEFKHLNNKVLKPAVKEINGSLKKYVGTDIAIEPEFKRQGRAVSDIRFRIESNKQIPLALEKNNYEDIRKTPHYVQLVEFGMSDKGAIHIIQSTEHDTLTQNIEATQQALEAGRISSSVTGFLTQAIKENYQPTVNKTEKQKAEEQLKKKEAAREKQKNEAKTKQESKRKIYSKQLREEYIATLTEQEQVDLLAQLRDNKTPMIKKLIKSLSSPQIASELNEHIPSFDTKLEALMNG